MDFLLAAEILADVLTYIPSEKDCCMKSGLAAATNTGRLLVASVGGTAGCRTCTIDVRAAGAMVTPGLSRAYATSDGTTTAKLKTKPLNNSAEPPVCCFATWPPRKPRVSIVFHA